MEALERAIVRARRDTIGDAVGRSAGRNPQKDALIFGERRWSYAQLDAGANRAANALLERGLEPGDRAAAYGMNSDTYVLLWLGCARAGVVHVPINFALAGDELLYVLEQSSSKALFHDPAFEERVAEVRDRAGATLYGTLHGGDGLDGLDVLEMAQSGDDSAPEVDIGEEDLAQVCYTSGTTAAPKGAMMSHRAYLAEYMSCIEALEYRREDTVLHSLPLYHTAQMHVFLMPQLLVGATNFLVAKPDPEECCRIIEREGIDSMFAPPTVWISFLRHPAFDEHDLSSLKKIQYGASIMPLAVVRELRERLGSPRLYNCYG